MPVASLTLAARAAVGTMSFASHSAAAPRPRFPAGRTFSDDVTGRAGTVPSPSLWRAETGGGWGNNELQTYTARMEAGSWPSRITYC